MEFPKILAIAAVWCAISAGPAGSSAASRAPTGTVTVLPDDWVTQGQWPGRYGQRLWVMCGMSGRTDYTGQAYGFARRTPGRGRTLKLTPLPKAIPYRVFIGTHCAEGDGLRAWIHWVTLPLLPPRPGAEEPAKAAEKASPLGMRPWQASDVPKVLINPVTGLRRQADYDDHAEAYRPWFFRQGPHIFVPLEVPDGPHTVSLYFMNKDGDQHVNRFRDYRLIVKEARPEYGKEAGWEDGFDAAPELARARVSDFYSGVYKRFLVIGPRRLVWKVDKGRSLNAILAGIFVDPVHAVAKSLAPEHEGGPEQALDAEVSLLRRELRDLSSLELGGDALRGKLDLIERRAASVLKSAFEWREADLNSYMRDSGARFAQLVSAIQQVIGWKLAAVDDRDSWLELETWYHRLAQLYHDIAQFDLRDHALQRLCQSWARTVHTFAAAREEGDEGSPLEAAARDLRRLYLRLHEFPWLTRATEQAAMRQFCRAISTIADADTAAKYLRHYATERCLSDPLGSETVFHFVEDELFPKTVDEAMRRFTKRELYAAGMAARQQQKHFEAVRRFEEFVKRYPRTAQRWQVTDHLAYHREQASCLMKLRYPDVKDPSAVLPKEEPPKAVFDPLKLEPLPPDPTDLVPPNRFGGWRKH